MPWAVLIVAAVVIGGAIAVLDRATQDERDAGPHDADITLGWHRAADPAWPDPEDISGFDRVNAEQAVPNVSTGTFLINVWASTCGPCRSEMHLLQRFDGTDGVHVLGISRDADADLTATTLGDFGVTYPNWIDTRASFSEALAADIPVDAIPSTLLVEDGRIVSAHVGAFHTFSSLRKQVGEQLNPAS